MLQMNCVKELFKTKLYKNQQLLCLQVFYNVTCRTDRYDIMGLIKYCCITFTLILCKLNMTNIVTRAEIIENLIIIGSGEKISSQKKYAVYLKKNTQIKSKYI